jgi:hypothetical protein
VTASVSQPRVAPRPVRRSALRPATLFRDTGTVSAHVAVAEPTHLPTKGRADAAAADVA